MASDHLYLLSFDSLAPPAKAGDTQDEFFTRLMKPGVFSSRSNR